MSNKKISPSEKIEAIKEIIKSSMSANGKLIAISFLVSDHKMTKEEIDYGKTLEKKAAATLKKYEKVENKR